MEKIFAKINELYKFSEPVKILGKVKKGYLSNNFIIGNKKERYFLKEYHCGDGSIRVRNTHMAKIFFSQNGIPVILPLENNKKKTFFVDREKVYAIFPYVKGRHFSRLNVPRNSLREASGLLAKIHLLSKNGVSIRIRKRNFIIDKNKSLIKARNILSIIKKNKNKTGFDKKVLFHLEERIKCIQKRLINVNRRNLGKRHLIHGDFHEENMFFTKNGKISHLFDWEMVSCAPRVMEIARSLDFFCFYGNYQKKNFSMANDYLRAYNDIYPIEKEELLNGLMAWFYNKMHSIWSLEEYYLNKRKDSKKFIEQEMKSFGYYRDNLDDFKKKIDKIIF